MRFRRITATVAAGVLTLGATLTMTRASAGVGEPITWHGCATGPADDLGAALETAGAQCARIAVPLDYRSVMGGLRHGRSLETHIVELVRQCSQLGATA